jgi:hypothetical protein
VNDRNRSNGSATSPTLDAALACLLEGLWPVAIYAAGETMKLKSGEQISKGKEPVGSAWGLKRQTEKGLRGLFRHRPDRGAGVCVGPGRGPGGRWLSDLEGDGPAAAASLGKLLDGDIRTRGWTSTRGGHLLFIADGERLLELLVAAGAKEGTGDKAGVWHLDDYPGLEWRIGGFKPDGQTVKQVQSVIPPTRGTDGKSREWNGVQSIAELPESVYAALKAIGERKAVQGESRSASSKATARDKRGGGWKSLDDEIAGFGSTGAGGRHAYMLGMTLRLASRVKAGRLAEQEALDALEQGARKNGMHGEGRWPEVKEAWRSAMELADPAKAGPGGKGRSAIGDTAQIDYSKLSDAELGIVPCKLVVMAPVKWLWPYRFALGEMALAAGEGGQGKSTLLLDLAARVTIGAEFPDKSGFAPLGSVIIVSAEDRRENTLKPRLVAMGADIDRVTFVTALRTIPSPDGSTPPMVNPMSLGDLAYWMQIVERVSDCRLMIIDPIPSYLGRGVNDARNAELRGILEPFLTTVIRPKDICLAANSHLSKNVDARTPIHRVTGSIAYVNLARNVHLIAADPDNPERIYLTQAKANNSPRDLGALAFSLHTKMVLGPDGVEIETVLPVFEDGTVEVELKTLMTHSKRPEMKGGRPLKETIALAQFLVEWLRAKGPQYLGAIADAAGEAELLGVSSWNDDKKRYEWSKFTTLYRAKDVVNAGELDGAQAGWRIVTPKDDPSLGGRNTSGKWAAERAGGATDASTEF